MALDSIPAIEIEDTTVNLHDLLADTPKSIPLHPPTLAQTVPVQLPIPVPLQLMQNLTEAMSVSVNPEQMLPILLLHTPNLISTFDPRAGDIQDTAFLQRLKRKDLNELCFLYRVAASGKNSDCIAHLQSLPKSLHAVA